MSQKSGSILEQIAMLRAFVSSATESSSSSTTMNNGWTDYDLTDCLRKCGYNVERAAECLITGQYKRNGSSIRLSSSSFSRHPQQVNYNVTTPAAATTTHTSNNRNNKMTPKSALQLRHPNNVSSSSSSTSKKPPSSESSHHSYSTTTTITTIPTCPSPPPSGWILCRRWISDAICTTRHGQIGYQEPLQLVSAGTNHQTAGRGSHRKTGTVRFRGLHMEGHLPVALAAILAPLATTTTSTSDSAATGPDGKPNNRCLGLISLQAHSLMASTNTPMGAHVPLAITVMIVQPQAFFQLFAAAQEEKGRSNNTQETTMSSLGRENQKRRVVVDVVQQNKKKRAWPLLAQAAFELLQWAEYGDVFNFSSVAADCSTRNSTNDNNHGADTIRSKPNESGGRNKRHSDTTTTSSSDDGNEGDNDSTNEQEDDEMEVLLQEDDFEEESVATTAEAQEMDQTLTTNTSNASLPETECPNDMKIRGIELRPYQKQALHWMLERENKASRQQLEEQLAFLSELAEEKPSMSGNSANSSSSSSNGTPHHHTSSIVCECGPVLVLSEEERIKSKTLDGRQVNPMHHPLWKRRFLASPDLVSTVSFYVNELLGVVTDRPPEPPQPCSGGILADSMGLGKTVMLMALMAHCKEKRSALPDSQDAPSTTLVVAKLSLLPQWEEELKSKTSLSSLVYYGDKSLSVDDLQKADVVVTTYGTVQGEFKRKETKSFSSLFDCSWLRVILDEAHCIRNHRTVASKACCSLRATHRWCVSGTIIQNSLEDVFGIIKFLKHEPWSLSTFWKAAISKPMAATSNTTSDSEQKENKKMALDRVRRLLSPIMLRRTKDSLTQDGKPILSLPEKDIKTIHIELSDSEREFYNAVLARSQSLFAGFVDSGKASTSYLQIFAMLQRLRQVCDHIGLTVQNRFNDQDAKVHANTDLSASVASTENEVASPPGEDGIEKKFLEGLLGKFYSRPPSPKKKKREEGCAESPPKKVKVDDSYISQVAGMVASIVKKNATHLNEECAICLEVPRVEDAALTPCAHIYCRDCLIGFLRGKASQLKEGRPHPFIKDNMCPDGECPTCNEMVVAKRIIVLDRSRDESGTVCTRFLLDSKPATPTAIPKGCEQPLEENSKHAVARHILQQSVRGTQSSKMNAIMEELDNVWRLDPKSKVLIFSHYLGFLDLLEMQLGQAGIPFFRLDGSLNLRERMLVLEQFRSHSGMSVSQEKTPLDDENVQKGAVLLMSMSAGAEGLNLVSASSCFVVEPWWNLAREDQCVNRIHRIGQTADIVRVRKFVVNDTVEERIVELQNRKKDVADAVYSEGEIGEAGSARLGLEDFRLIFQR